MITAFWDAPWHREKGLTCASQATWLFVSWNSHGCSLELLRLTVKGTHVSSLKWPTARGWLSLLCGYVSPSNSCMGFFYSFPRPKHSLAFMCGCTCFLTFFFLFRVLVEIFMQVLIGYLCQKQSWQWLWLKAKRSVSCAQVGRYLSKNGLVSMKSKQALPSGGNWRCYFVVYIGYN